MSTNYIVYDDFDEKISNGKTHGENVVNASKSIIPNISTFTINNGPGALDYKKFYDALNFAAKNSFQVVNLSYGGGFSNFLGEGTFHTFNSDGKLIYDNFKKAFDNGISLVVSAGNMLFGSSHINSDGYFTSVLTSTGYAISVGAANQDPFGNITPETYSNIHPGMVDFFIEGSIDGVRGTSFSAPRVSAVISELQERYDNKLSQANILTMLELGSDYFVYNKNIGSKTPSYDRGEFNTYRYLDIEKTLSLEYTINEINTEMRVAAMYELFLGRNPDQDGFDFWVERLNTTGDYLELANGFKASDEFKNMADATYDKITIAQKVQAMYHLYLNREADDVGLSYWIDTTHKIQNFPQAGSLSELPINFEPILVTFIGAARNNGEFIADELIFF